jgi:hypothetical protein
VEKVRARSLTTFIVAGLLQMHRLRDARGIRSLDGLAQRCFYLFYLLGLMEVCHLGRLNVNICL